MLKVKIEFKAFCERLNIKYNEAVIPYYIEAKRLCSELGNYIFDKERLTALNNKYNVFRKYFDEVLMAADEISMDKDLVLHTYIYISIIKQDGNVKILETVNRERMDTDFAPLYAFLYFLPDMAEKMEKRGLPISVISDTLNEFECEMNDYHGIYGRHGVRTYVEWFMLWIRGVIFRFGRLQFELITIEDRIRVYKKGEDIKILMDSVDMHRGGMVFGAAGQDGEEGKYFAAIDEKAGEVSGYAVNELGECVPERITLVGYKEALRRGDKALSVHIIADEPFSAEACEESYAEAIRRIRECYPEFDFKAVHCHSWMLEKRLRQIMGRDTNITRFADKYHAYPTASRGTSVYTFLFHLPSPTDAQELPEDTSMQRAVKEYLCRGNYFYKKAGIFLI